MKKIFFVSVLTLMIFLASVAPARGQGISSARLVNSPAENQEMDYRCLKLFHFLKSRKSPLVSFSGQFVSAADIWEIDWRLLPAIAGLESCFGKRMVSGTYNAYGWGGGYIGFSSWEDSIYHVSRKLRENYYDKGLSTPSTIGRVYAPPNPKWGNLIASIMNKI